MGRAGMDGRWFNFTELFGSKKIHVNMWYDVGRM